MDMKQYIIHLCLASSLALAACSGQESLPKQEDGQEVLELTASMPELTIITDTKSTLDQGTTFSWEENDQLGFIPSASATHPESDRQSMFYMKNVSQDGKDAKFIGNGWGLIRGKRYYSYYPYSAENSCSSVCVNYTGQTQASNGSSSHLGDYDFLHSWADIPATGEINLSYRRIGCVAKITITVPQSKRSAKFTKMTLSANEKLFLASGTYNPSQEYPIRGNNNQAETVSLSTSSKAGAYVLNLGTGNGFSCDSNGQLILYVMMSPTAWAGKTISLALDGFSGAASNTFQITGSISPSKNQSAGVCYNYSSVITEIVTPEPDNSTDLGANGTANCYIVTSSGKYRFRADVKGNGVAVGTEGSSLATPTCAYLVWETVNTTTAPTRNSIITNVVYKDGYVYFDVPDNGIAGNAMIALLNVQATDSFTANGGKTIWVWHIWRLSAAPSDDNYGSGVVFMDRNLGALNNTPGDGRAIGFLYQWGRPVPFLGAADYTSNNTETVARVVNSTDNSGTSVHIPYWLVAGPFPLNDIFGSPLQFMAGVNGNRNWSSEYATTLWGATKTQYDPCPPGYKVPANFSGFALAGTYNNTGASLNYNGGTSYWWPMCGLRGLYFDKELTNTGHDCFYWAGHAEYYSVVSGNCGYGMNFNLNDTNRVFTYQPSYIISGNSVRCQKIQ